KRFLPRHTCLFSNFSRFCMMRILEAILVYATRRWFCLLVILLSLAIEDSHAQSFVSIGNMLMPRIAHSATLLQDGRVLIASGTIAEIYDPASGTFAETGAMAAARAEHAAVLLQDGRVLLVGGCSFLCDSELYDPATGMFTRTGHMSVGQRI